MELEFLNNYEEENAMGPIQRDEALFLYAISRVIRPKNVLEFGTSKGHSAKVWLESGIDNLWTVDVCPSLDPSLGLDKYGDRFHPIIGNMTDFREPEDISFDLIFFDASHEMEDNRKTFLNLRDPKFIAVHDTGTWSNDHLNQIHKDFRGGLQTENGIIHQPQEVQFVEWLEYAGFKRVDFHSINTIRHGISILQKK